MASNIQTVDIPLGDSHASEHFKFRDFMCPCCRKLPLSEIFYRHIEKLEEMRVALGFPLIVNSGYRCPDHNAAVGGTNNSWHKIFATDIRPEDHNELKLKRIVAYAKANGWGGIGIYKTFCHLDTREDRTIWYG